MIEAFAPRMGYRRCSVLLQRLLCCCFGVCYAMIQNLGNTDTGLTKYRGFPLWILGLPNSHHFKSRIADFVALSWPARRFGKPSARLAKKHHLWLPKCVQKVYQCQGCNDLARPCRASLDSHLVRFQLVPADRRGMVGVGNTPQLTIETDTDMEPSEPTSLMLPPKILITIMGIQFGELLALGGPIPPLRSLSSSSATTFLLLSHWLRAFKSHVLHRIYHTNSGPAPLVRGSPSVEAPVDSG